MQKGKRTRASMSLSSVDLLLDAALDIANSGCRVLGYGPPHRKLDTTHSSYQQATNIVRFYFGLMGETTPDASPLSVDIANDISYRVYRYDWVIGIACIQPSRFFWDWQRDLKRIVVQAVIVPGDSGFRFTSVAANLNVLLPSRDTTGWFQKNQKVVLDAVASATDAVQPVAGKITKAVAALSSSLQSDGKRGKNWFIYQFLDDLEQATAIEWNINKDVMREFGPVLRGSLVLAFHGVEQGHEKGRRGIHLLLRPQFGFHEGTLDSIIPTKGLPNDEQVRLEVFPQIAATL